MDRHTFHLWFKDEYGKDKKELYKVTNLDNKKIFFNRLRDFLGKNFEFDKTYETLTIVKIL